jgi:hypothetical protein
LLGGKCAQNAIDNAIANLPPDSAGGAAAAIKKDEADAKARRLAVRYLGTVDCFRYPQASEALRLSLRADPNECVRWEAALALRNGCCCTNAIIKALEMTVTGSKADGFPEEKSDRVRAAAAEALARCPLVETIVEKDKIEIRKTDAKPIDPKDFYARVNDLPRQQVTAAARGALVSVNNAGKPAVAGFGSDGAASQAPPIHRRPGSLVGVLANTFNLHDGAAPAEPDFPQHVAMPPVTSAPAPVVVAPVVPARITPVAPVTPVAAPVKAPAPSGLKVEIMPPIPASNPNAIRQTTGWVTVVNAPATIGAPMPIGPAPMNQRK